MLSIYLKTDDWHEMDFDNFQIALNDTIQNIHNPLKMNTEYSKTISLPLTAKNREIIQHYSRLDSLVTTTFDATKAIPVRMVVDGNIIFEGSYAITKVDVSRNRIEGNFYSVVNTWINKLKNLTWDDFPEVLKQKNSVTNQLEDFSINKDNIYASWMAYPALRSTNFNLPTDERHYKWTDWIGFAPMLNGELSDFSCDAMFRSGADDGAVTYHPWEVISMGGGEPGLQILKTIYPKPSERQMLQFRSYYQKPYIYVDNLFKLIQYKCSWDDELPFIDFDEDWTDSSNPNWRNLIYFLPNLLKTDDKPVVTTQVYNLNNPISYVNSGFQLTRGNTWTTKTGPNMSLTCPDDPNHTLVDSDGWIIGDGKTIDYIIPVTFSLNFAFTASNSYNDEGGLHGWNKKMRLIGQMCLDVELVDQNGQVVADSSKRIYQVSNGQVYQTTVTTSSQSGQTSYNISWGLNGSGVYSHAFTTTAGSKYKPRFKWSFKNVYTQWTGVYEWNSTYTLFVPDISGMEQFDYYYIDDMLIPAWTNHNNISFDTHSQNTSNDIHRLRYAEAGRSGKKYTMKDIWGTVENNTPFMVLLKYMKMFNLTMYYDKNNNSIKILPKEKFFEQGYNEGIEDWTNKVDFGKDMSFKPLSWEDRYVEFNYADTDLTKIKTFKDKYGFNYGTKRIKTSYTFNNETKELLEDVDSINASAEMSEYMFNMYQLNRISSNPTATVQLEEAFLVAEADMINNKDGKMADMTNCFAYRWDYNTYWDRNLNRLANGVYHGYIYITDDCQYENNNGSWNYQPTLSGNITWTNNKCSEHYCVARRLGIIGTKPRISHYITKTVGTGADALSTDYCCLFSVPREDYFNPNVVARNNQDLWTTRWSNLITEMYSMQNKLLTCYVYLTPEDYNKFKFNKFIIIDNVLYLVNKIIDYNPASLEATKCELIQVDNPGAYTTAPTNNVTSTSSLTSDNEFTLKAKNDLNTFPTLYKEIKDYTEPFYLKNTTTSSKTARFKNVGSNVTAIDIYYSSDKINWTLAGQTSRSGITVSVPAGKKVYIKATTNQWADDSSNYNYIQWNYTVGGNIMSLLYGDSFADKFSFPTNSYLNFYRLFGTGSSNYSPVDVMNLLMPATTLTVGCYCCMFDNSRFEISPELPAHTLANDCYGDMFYRCSNLNVVKCYMEGNQPVDLTLCTHNWLSGVAANGLFIKSPNATWPTGVSGIPDGWEVQDTQS